MFCHLVKVYCHIFKLLIIKCAAKKKVQTLYSLPLLILIKELYLKRWSQDIHYLHSDVVRTCSAVIRTSKLLPRILRFMGQSGIGPLSFSMNKTRGPNTRDTGPYPCSVCDDVLLGQAALSAVCCHLKLQVFCKHFHRNRKFLQTISQKVVENVRTLHLTNGKLKIINCAYILFFCQL